jgi:hypothetical protein
MEVVDHAVMAIIPGAMDAGLVNPIFWIGMMIALTATARPVSAAAFGLLSTEGLSVAGVLPRLAASAALGDPTVAPSFVALAEQLVAASEADEPKGG